MTDKPATKAPVIDPLPFAVDCRGPADWVELEVFHSQRNAETWAKSAAQQDIRDRTICRWEYRVRQKGVDISCETTQSPHP